MRLKTLRKERPAFENEGAVINGSRMDLSNSECKPAKHRTNNSFVLPTSLNTDFSSLNLSASNQTPELNNNYPQQTLPRRTFPLSSPSQPTHVSTYQAIEAAYLEHGIRIHLNSTTAATVNQQSNLTENLTDRKPANNIHRQKAFVNRNPSRTSSALHYSTTVYDANQDSRPFSALQQTSTGDFEQTNPNQNLSTQPIESQNKFQIIQPLNNNYCSSSIVASEHFDHNQLTIPNDTTSTTTLINNDPDLAYMSSLLQTTSGDSFRDTIRRRAGLRGTFAVHRHPQLSVTTSNSKLYEKSSVVHSPNTNRRNSLLRTSTIAVVPTTVVTPSSQKLEKDILKHASRIRTNHIKESFLRYQNSLKLKTNDHISSPSNSPTRTTYQTKRNQLLKPSKSMNLEPLELLLAPSHRPLPARTTSLSLHGSPAFHQENIKSSKKHTKSPKISFIENNHIDDSTTKKFFLNEQLNSSFLNDENLLLMKTSSLDIITNQRRRQSNSLDSGCYDRSSSSGDTHSILSSSINQAPSSLPSARLTSASTRRSNINKKVSFEDQSTAMSFRTTTYV